MSSFKGPYSEHVHSSQQGNESGKNHQEMVLFGLGICLLVLSVYALFKIVLWLHRFFLFQIAILQHWWYGPMRRRRRRKNEEYESEDEEYNEDGQFDDIDEEEEEVVYVKKKKNGTRNRRKKKVRYEYE